MTISEDSIYFMKNRPTDMLERQLAANRAAAKYRHPSTNRRHFCHLNEYRAAYVLDILEIRAELTRRNTF